MKKSLRKKVESVIQRENGSIDYQVNAIYCDLEEARFLLEEIEEGMGVGSYKQSSSQLCREILSLLFHVNVQLVSIETSIEFIDALESLR